MIETIAAPSPRRFTFSLRTMFLVLIPLASLGSYCAYQARWVRQRELVLAQEAENCATAIRQGMDNRVYRFTKVCDQAVPAPLVLRLFGVRGVGVLVVFVSAPTYQQLSAADQARLAHVASLFPETTILPFCWNGSYAGVVR